MSYPVTATLMEQLRYPIPDSAIAIPEGLRPTAVYAPGMPIPDGMQDPLYGAFLLSSVAEYFGHFSRYQYNSDLWKITLWSVITHIRDPKTKKPLLPMIPRLMMLGESGCGKSTDLQLLNLVCACTDDLELEPTEPAVRSILGPEQLTLLLDEADILFGTGNRKSAIRSILNASAYPNGHTDRIQGGKRVKDMVYGPAAIAALPTMEVATGGVLESLMNRSHKIYKFQPDEAIPQILEDAEGIELGKLACKLIEMWVQTNLQRILAAIPAVQPVPGINPHRDMQKWRAMLAVAEVAGGTWPQYARDAALAVKDTESLKNFRKRMAGLK